MSALLWSIRNLIRRTHFIASQRRSAPSWPLTRIAVTPRHAGRKQHMGDLPAPNPALARKVWDSMTRPSTRRVATKLRQSGASISHMTVARWRNRGWRPLEREQHPLEATREQLDDAVPLLTGDPTTVAEDRVKES